MTALAAPTKHIEGATSYQPSPYVERFEGGQRLYWGVLWSHFDEGHYNVS